VEELRPITLLQIDYKLVTKVMTQRIVLVMPQVIKSGQLCAIKGRNIVQGVKTLIMTLILIQMKNIKAALVILDQENVYLFPSLSRSWLPSALVTSSYAG
jgi:hypothetical protein